MTHANAKPAAGNGGLRQATHSWRKRSAVFTSPTFRNQAARCAGDPTPILSQCQELLRQGVDPDRAAEVFANGIQAIRVRANLKPVGEVWP
jgi:hypothetical protein